MAVADAPKKSRNKKVAAGIGVAAIACAAIAIGSGTYAAFSDTKAGPGGTLAAGTLSLSVGGSVQTPTVDLSKIKPGDTVHATVTVQNTGSINGNLTATYSLTGSENGCTAAETNPLNNLPACTSGSNGDLVGALELKVNGASVPNPGAGNGSVNVGPLNPSGTATTYDVEITLPQSTDSRVQSDTASLTSTLTLTQA
ncbi:TasA family protein [Pseudonocardia sp.]|uniref:TasA family protein n=1 Tax=Pseudonocardia sp. TaxID=60912 RepID=UPI003D129494